jgi:Uma2 family endonuclease
VLRLDPIVQLTDSQIEALSSINEILRIERNAQGDLELQYLRPTLIAHRNAKISTQLYLWAKNDGSGVAFASSVGFTLPNGALRSPDASWVLKSRLAELTEEQKNGFPPMSPDFVIELRSDTDNLSILHRKMDEYMANGVRLGWLIDTVDCLVHVYRNGVEVEMLERPESLSGEPELPGFTLDLQPIWEPGF